jgi:hypothetical protein
MGEIFFMVQSLLQNSHAAPAFKPPMDPLNRRGDHSGVSLLNDCAGPSYPCEITIKGCAVNVDHSGVRAYFKLRYSSGV